MHRFQESVAAILPSMLWYVLVVFPPDFQKILHQMQEECKLKIRHTICCVWIFLLLQYWAGCKQKAQVMEFYLPDRNVQILHRSRCMSDYWQKPKLFHHQHNDLYLPGFNYFSQQNPVLLTESICGTLDSQFSENGKVAMPCPPYYSYRTEKQFAIQ